MQSMAQFGNAGSAFIGEKNQAAAGMRSMRDDLWRRIYDLRQKSMQGAARDNGKDRRLAMISAGLNAGAQLPFGSMFGGGQTQPQAFDNVPQQMLQPPSYLPREMMPERFRMGLA